MSSAAEPERVLIGEKFVTYRMSVAGELAIVKMEDYALADRENTRSYREYLAFRLASRIGLRVPCTSLRLEPQYGRMSVQRYLHGVTQPTLACLEQVAVSSLGMRIALFDTLCGNHDRKPANLLQLGADLIPIDFNTAFQTDTTGVGFNEETDIILARWFRIRGMLSLTPTHQSVLLGEVHRMVERLDDPFLQTCLGEIPKAFCASAEVEQVRDFLVLRRDRLYDSVSTWWDKTIAPLHQFEGDALEMAIRVYTR